MTDKFLKKTSKIGKKVLNAIINILFVLALLLISFIVIQKVFFKDSIPQVFGYKVLQVVSGSMSGEIEVGQTIVIKSIKDENDLKVGDIVTYKEDNSTIITHRIIEINEEKGQKEYVLKGDANNTHDIDPVHFDQMEGKYLFTITWLSSVIEFISTPIGMITLCAIPLVLLGLFNLKERKNELKKKNRMEKRLNYELKEAKKDEQE